LNEFGHFYHGETGQLLSEQGPIATDNEIQIFNWNKNLPNHSLISWLTKQHGNQLNLNYLIYNIIDNFMIFSLWIIDTCYYLG